ncbi:MAG: GlsB/YeaQ/YmgE family stress response membrane protein [Bradyrhizobiaceae bacterium]|nr:GlsB/YeaQ/YmgE family stress response membrane protein [Bradyrhizobiaceae bacterium]
MPSLSQILVWIAVGLIGGSLAGLAVKGRREGYGILRNLVLGLIGALVGGFLFRVFGLFPRLDLFAISLRDVVAAFVGSLIVLAAIWLYEKYK